MKEANENTHFFLSPYTGDNFFFSLPLSNLSPMEFLVAFSFSWFSKTMARRFLWSSGSTVGKGVGRSTGLVWRTGVFFLFKITDSGEH